MTGKIIIYYIDVLCKKGGKDIIFDLLVEAFDQTDAVKKAKEYIIENCGTNFIMSEPTVVRFNTIGVAVLFKLTQTPMRG